MMQEPPAWLNFRSELLCSGVLIQGWNPSGGVWKGAPGPPGRELLQVQSASCFGHWYSIVVRKRQSVCFLNEAILLFSKYSKQLLDDGRNHHKQKYLKFLREVPSVV